MKLNATNDTKALSIALDTLYTCLTPDWDSDTEAILDVIQSATFDAYSLADLWYESFKQVLHDPGCNESSTMLEIFDSIGEVALLMSLREILNAIQRALFEVPPCFLEDVRNAMLPPLCSKSKRLLEPYMRLYCSDHHEGVVVHIQGLDSNGMELCGFLSGLNSKKFKFTLTPDKEKAMLFSRPGLAKLVLNMCLASEKFSTQDSRKPGGLLMPVCSNR